MAKQDQTHSKRTILRRGLVQARTGLSRSTIYALIAAGEFPPAIRLSKAAVGWVESEIDSWVEQRIRASRPAAKGGCAND